MTMIPVDRQVEYNEMYEKHLYPPTTGADLYYATTRYQEIQPSPVTGILGALGSPLGEDPSGEKKIAVSPIWQALAVAGLAGGAYHGYKRTGSWGWALGWALLGGLFPIITLPVAAAQGFGKPERK